MKEIFKNVDKKIADDQKVLQSYPVSKYNVVKNF